MKSIISEAVSWTWLKSLQENKIVKSTYIWLFIVPLIAKLFNKIEQKILSIEINSVKYIFDLTLSFSWIMLFISALLFVIGNIIYLFLAPKLIKKYNNYGDFLSKGESYNLLLNYSNKDIKLVNKEKSKRAKNINIDNQITSNSKKDLLYEEDERKNMFSDIFYYYNHKNFIGRLACSFFYLFGGILFSIILIKNIYWVFMQLL